MKLIYGTNNKSKIESMNRIVKDLKIEVNGLRDLKMKLNEPTEDGSNPLENAIKKSRGYYQQIGIPVFSCDSGLYFENVEDSDQPGTEIKRIHGQELEGKEFIDYYSKLAKKYGGKLTAYYKNSISLVLSDDLIYNYDGSDLDSERFYIVDKPHKEYKEGYPLDSLSVDIVTNQYFYDIEGEELIDPMIDGFRGFFERVLKEIDIIYKKK